MLRILIVKQRTGFSYEELAFHLADSVTYRSFCGFGALEPTPSRSTLAENIKKVQPKTLEKIQRRLVRYAVKLGMETGDKVRLDATVSETNIHHPTDSSLLNDGVRVLSRLLGEAQAVCGFRPWSDHTKRAKRRMLAIHNTGDAELRVAGYEDLLKVTQASMGYADAALRRLRAVRGRRREEALALAAGIEDKLTWIWAVIDQTERRVLDGESVPSQEKIVSIFEPHTDIIVKDRRETLYGHKLFLAAGASGLITDCVIADGNPADTTMALPLLVRQKRILGRVPEQVAFDGGFASKANLQGARDLGIREVAFSKKKGLSIADMTSNPKTYQPRLFITW